MNRQRFFGKSIQAYMVQVVKNLQDEQKKLDGALVLAYPNLGIDADSEELISDVYNKVRIMSIISNVPPNVNISDILDYLYESGRITDYEYYCAYANSALMEESDDLYKLIISRHGEKLVDYQDLLLSDVVRTYNIDMQKSESVENFADRPFVYINEIDQKLFSLDLICDETGCDKNFYNEIHRHISKVYRIAVDERRPAYLFRIINKLQDLNIKVNLSKDNDWATKYIPPRPDLEFVCAIELERNGSRLYIVLLFKR